MSDVSRSTQLLPLLHYAFEAATGVLGGYKALKPEINTLSLTPEKYSEIFERVQCLKSENNMDDIAHRLKKMDENHVLEHEHGQLPSKFLQTQLDCMEDERASTQERQQAAELTLLSFATLLGIKLQRDLKFAS